MVTHFACACSAPPNVSPPPVHLPDPPPADPAKPKLVYRSNSQTQPWPAEYEAVSPQPTPEQCCDWCRKSWDCAYWVHQSYSGVSAGCGSGD